LAANLQIKVFPEQLNKGNKSRVFVVYRRHPVKNLDLTHLIKYPNKKPRFVRVNYKRLYGLFLDVSLFSAKKKFVIFIGVILCFTARSQFVIDSSYIAGFKKTNDVEVYTGVTKTSFRFRKFTNDNYISQHKLFANTSAYAGVTIDYNWLSLSYSRNIPNTSVAKQSTSIKAFGIHLRKTHEKFLFEVGTDKYKGLILKINRRHGEYEYYDDINYRSYFTRVTYVFNAERFSTNAARSFSLRQIKSAGSFMISLSPLLQRFTLKNGFNEYEPNDSAFLSEISKKPSSLSLIVNGGYTYNFVFDEGEWSINPGLIIGPSIQKNLFPEHGQSLKLIANYELSLNGGYNGEHYYFHVNASYSNRSSNLMNSKMSVNERGISLTIGYRMGKLKKKIVGLL
jgi:hypothetical protein